MAYQPIMPLAKCPCCESICGEPKLRRKGFVRMFWKYECACGVSGSWQLDRGGSRPENLAAIGWEHIAGKPVRPAPPTPVRRKPELIGTGVRKGLLNG